LAGFFRDDDLIGHDGLGWKDGFDAGGMENIERTKQLHKLPFYGNAREPTKSCRERVKLARRSAEERL
jgi:hypothetical protein